MKTHDFGEMLTAFSGLADAEHGDALRKLARALMRGEGATIAARIKKMGPSNGHPGVLKGNLEKIEVGLREAGAKKQATAVRAVLKTFSGTANLPVDDFIAQICAPPPAPKKKLRTTPDPDHSLARSIADELTRAVLNTSAFNEVVTRLRHAKVVNTPTLTVVANQFLGNSRNYRGRKAAIDDIIERQRQEAREHARGKALDRIGV